LKSDKILNTVFVVFPIEETRKRNKNNENIFRLLATVAEKGLRKKEVIYGNKAPSFVIRISCLYSPPYFGCHYCITGTKKN
jgi:hypothetical protein